MIQRLLLRQKPEVPKKIQVVIPTQIICHICEMMRRIEFSTLSIKVSLWSITLTIRLYGYLYDFSFPPSLSTCHGSFLLHGFFLLGFPITLVRRTH